MSEMLERVKQTIIASQGKSPDAMARAILAAMREPTDAIVQIAAPYVPADHRRGLWTSMIDSCLRETPKKKPKLEVIKSS